MNGSPTFRDRIAGAFLGVAVGDSIGLPAEGLSRDRIANGNWNPWRQRMVFRRGMVSDDTEHTVLVAEAILASRGDGPAFEKALSAGLRRWFLAAPPGIGWATLRACLKLCVGVSPVQSGVFSAGNGPAMRSGIIGAVFPDNETTRRALGEISTRITHSDPIALIGARIVTEQVAANCRGDLFDVARLSEIAANTTGSSTATEVWQEALKTFRDATDQELSVGDFANALGYAEGVPGYIVPSVLVAIYATQRHEDFRSGLTAVLNCGGDTDSNGAIFGALAGASGGIQEIPEEWIFNIRDWPCSVRRLNLLAQALSRLAGLDAGMPVEAIRIYRPLPLILFRNFVFIFLLIGHLAVRFAVWPFQVRSRLVRHAAAVPDLPR